MNQANLNLKDNRELIKISFFVPSEPTAKGRARSFFNSKTGNIDHVTPKKTKVYEKIFREYGEYAMYNHRLKNVIPGPIKLKLIIVMPIPNSWSNKKKLLAEQGRLLPTTKPDADNIEKAVKDALNRVCWIDDSYVVYTVKSQRYRQGADVENPLKVGVYVSISQIDAYPAQQTKF